MGLYMRAIVREWHEPPFEELAAFVAQRSPFRVNAVGGRVWSEFEALDQGGTTVLALDLTTGADVREELDELEVRRRR